MMFPNLLVAVRWKSHTVPKINAITNTFMLIWICWKFFISTILKIQRQEIMETTLTLQWNTIVFESGGVLENYKNFLVKCVLRNICCKHQVFLEKFLFPCEKEAIKIWQQANAVLSFPLSCMDEMLVCCGVRSQNLKSGSIVNET